jgi:hypothetical protein
VLTNSAVWFFKNARHVGEAGFCDRTMYFSTVDFESSIPTFLSSPRIRGEPYNGFALDIVRIRSRTSLATQGRPGSLPLRLNPAQCFRKRRRCQAPTVSGWTKKTTSRQPDQILASQTQRSRSAGIKRGRRLLRRYTASWWRRAKISRCIAPRERADAETAASSTAKAVFMAADGIDPRPVRQDELSPVAASAAPLSTPMGLSGGQPASEEFQLLVSLDEPGGCGLR